MKLKAVFLGIGFLIVFMISSCTPQANFPVLKGPYLGQNPPGKTPEIFAPGIISTPAHEYSFTVLPDGSEMFFTRHIGEYSHIYYTKIENGRWTEPRVAPFSGKFADYDQCFAPDGNSIYFVSDRPRPGTPFIGDIWCTTRTVNGWSAPKNIGSPVNTDQNEACPSITKDGTLYFHAVYPDGIGSSDIYASKYLDGTFSKPVNLGSAVNSKHNDSNAFIAPDESYIIFGSRRPGGFGNGDLYISFRDKYGEWIEAIHMGDRVNSEHFEYCPSVSLDGKFLFFTRRDSSRNRKGDIYWMDAGIIEELRSELNRKMNSPSPSEYVIKTYESGFEKYHKKIGLEVSKNWAWPFEGFTEIYSDPNFDPETVLSCFKDNEMVGFVSLRLMGEGPGILINEGVAAYLDIPRVISGFEDAADLLMKKIIQTLKNKGVKLIRTRVSTMRKNSIELAKRWGFKPHEDYPLGYKIYYTYDLDKGKLDYPTNDLQSFDRDYDLEDCSLGVSTYFRMPKERAKNWILGFESREDLISHYVIRENGKLAGYCVALSNPHNEDIIATYYIEAANEDYMKQLIVRTVNDCIERNKKLYLIDIIGHLLKYEKLVKSLGFDNAATRGIFELKLD